MIDLAEGRRLLAAYKLGASNDGAHLTVVRTRIALADWFVDNAAALLDELEAARRDAERFRWLDGWISMSDMSDSCMICFPRGIQPAGEQLDDLRAAIDAAMGKGKS